MNKFVTRFVHKLLDQRKRQDTLASVPPEVSQRMLNSKGRTNVVRLGIKHSPWQDLYHLLLTISWSWFFGLTLLAYIVANTLFAGLYLIGADNLANAQPGSFWDAFFFSVQTMATIGYGAISPKSFYANVIVSIEAMLGLLGVAVVTGLAFARLARPTARVLFSRVAVVTPYNGCPTLMFRTANQRSNQILEARLWVSLVRDEVTEEGYSMRRFYDLKLSRSQNPVFNLTWTAMHPIDQDSPLYGETPESLAEDATEIVVSLTGIDETVAQTVHARYSYMTREILWNTRFADLLAFTADGRRAIDFSRFHDVREM
jgi:inward rectifier potassium channel